jgi:hypothetical protein
LRQMSLPFFMIDFEEASKMISRKVTQVHRQCLRVMEPGERLGGLSGVRCCQS